MEELIRFIPQDRLLTETDAPYLAPVPFRGQANTPVLVEHVFNYLAQVRGLSLENLNQLVDENIKKLFF
jgi:TatD DNase family protein